MLHHVFSLILSTIFLFTFVHFTATKQQKHAPDRNPVTMLKERIRDNIQAVEKIRPVYYNKHHKQWAKRKMSLANVEYDVRETDSLVSPYIGIVSFSCVLEQSAFYERKEEAIKTDDFNATRGETKCRMTYAFQEDEWVIKKFETLLEIPTLPKEWKEVDLKKEPESWPTVLFLNLR